MLMGESKYRLEKRLVAKLLKMYSFVLENHPERLVNCFQPSSAKTLLTGMLSHLTMLPMKKWKAPREEIIPPGLAGKG